MNKDIEESTKQEKKRRGFVFWLGRFFLVLLAIFFSVLVLIEIPFIQKWGAGKISDTIANTLNTKASIGGFSLNPISDLTLDDVFIGSPDRPQDTLIRVVHLHVDFQNIWDLFYNAFTINQVRLDDGFLNIEKKAGDTLTNLDIAMLRLRPEKRDTTRAPFVLDLERISATQLRVKIDDNTQGSLIDMVFKRADVELDTMDMTGQYMRIGEMDFDEPLIHVTNKSRKDVIPSSVKKSDKFWSFDVNSLNWTDGKIYIDNQNKPDDTSQVYGIDYAHMILADVDIAADSLRIRGFEFNGKNINIHILHQNGFEIKELSSSDASLTSNGINIKDLVLKTPESEIHNSIELQYSGFDDFKSFADSVNLLIPSADIHLHIIDLLAVAPALGKVSFFSDNKDKVFTLTGNVNGRINRLKVLQMNADIGGIILAGDFRSHDLAVPGNQLINMNLDRARFSATSLKDIFPKMKIPAMMNRFGQISFTGKFDGYPDDFVAFGTFNTALGAVTLDMKLNTIRGFEQGKYSGEISLANFDLGTFLNQPDIGRVSMTGRVIEGEGLNAQTLSADLSAVMSSFTYKNYTYQNARLDGQVSNKLFSGTIDIHDPNVDMMFEGTVDFRGEMPILDFITRIDDIRFLELGFGKIPIAVSGIFDVDLTAGKIDQFQGSLVGENVMVKIRDDIYSLDSLYVDALIDSVSNDRYYNIKSNVVSGVFSGVFDPLTLANQLQQYLHEQYPSLIDPPKKVMAVQNNQRLSWDLHIHDSGVWFELAGIKDLVIKNAYTQGTLNLQDQQTTGFLELPELHYAGVNVYGSTLNFKEQKGKTEIDLEVIAADLKENLFFEDVLISGSVTDDSMRVRVKTDDIAEIIQQLDMEITADPDEGAWAFSFNPIKLEMLDGSWSMPSGNLVQIKKDEFNLENFELTSGDRKITIDDINNKGIDAFITGFDVSYLNSLWINDKFQFSGIYTLKLEVDNVYNIRQLSTVLNVPALKVNNVPYGEWTFNAAMSDPKDSVKIDLVMNNNETHMTGKGAYLPPINTIPKEKQNYLRLAIEGTEFPLDFLEFLLGGNIRDTEGSVDFTLNLEGKTNKLNPRGKGRVYNGSTTINYLGTAYAFHDQPFEITETRIDLTGAKLYDVQGNSATIRGGLTHRYLKNLGLDASIHADKIIALDVTSEENTNFYGMGIGKVDAIFSGTIANPNMEINMTSAKGTHIFIPLSAAAVGTGKDFVIFLENGVLPASTTNLNKLSGINLTMNMTVTEDAEVEIIFDPNTGEVLRAVGRGDIKLAMTRTGNFTMYGDYRISRGDYLFTNLKIVRKQFELLPGGQISWEGDPYDATIDIRAKYKGLTAPIYTLIQEYTVNNPQIADEARERTEVDLTMILTGSLLHPNIAFDIEFPSLTGEIKGYADAKISALKANEVAMNEQVVGLLFTGSFLPSSGVSSLSITKGIDNTLTDFISSTLSSMLGGLLANLAPEAGFFTGIDLQVGIDVPITSSGTINSEGEIVDPARQEYYANLPLEFFNDRLSVNLGGNYVTGSTLTTTSEYLAGDVRVEYWITPDRRLKILAYNRNNMTIEGRKNKFGVGLAYRREYNSVKEIFSRKSKKPKEKDIETSGG